MKGLTNDAIRSFKRKLEDDAVRLLRNEGYDVEDVACRVGQIKFGSPTTLTVTINTPEELGKVQS